MSETAPPQADAARRPGLLGRMLGALSPRRHGHAVPLAASAHDFAFQSIDGAPMSLADYRGRALAIKAPVEKTSI